MKWNAGKLSTIELLGSCHLEGIPASTDEMGIFNLFVFCFRMAEDRGLDFFSEYHVLQRFKSPSTYFEKISTVAFKEVMIHYFDAASIAVTSTHYL